MKVFLVTPAAFGSLAGNRVTAERWAGISRELGHQAVVAERWDGEECDVLVALHARRSAPSVERAVELRPETPRVVALTGTDLYRDLPAGDRASRSSLRHAHLIVALHGKMEEALPADLGDAVRRKVRVIYQSAEKTESDETEVPGTTEITEARQTSESPREDVFQVCVLAHLRPVKDPTLAARAAALLPPESRIEIVHAGGEVEAGSAEAVRRAAAGVPRYRWVGPLPRAEALTLLSRSRLLLVTSQMEGAANVVSEALSLGVPILSTAIDGTTGVLGADYPGLFPVGDAEALASMLCRAEADPGYLARLAERCHARQHLVTPQRERSAWAALLAEAVGS